MENNILVVGPSWVGDMVMAQSLFKAIRQQNPNAVIDVLAPAWTHPLLDRMPEVRDNIFMPIGHGVLGLGVRYELAAKLKLNHYDRAIMLPNSWKSALVPFLAKIPRRTGWRGEMRWGVLNDLRYLDKKQYPRMVDRYVALGYDKNAVVPESPPAPELKVNEMELQAAKRKFSIKSYDDRPILILCPGSEFGPSKRWPESHFAEVASQKIQEGWQVWLMGSKNNVGISDRILEATKGECLNLTGRTELREAIDLMSLAAQVVSNDSGLMHIAAALNRPLVGIYGSTDTKHTPPLNAKAKTLESSLSCRPCFKCVCPLTHHQCMQGISSKQVLDAFDSPTV